MSTPPPPASGAEIDTFTITNTEVDTSNRVFAEVDQFANQDNANDITIVKEARPFAERSRRGAEGFVTMGMEAALQGGWRALRDRALAPAQSGSDPAEGIAAVSRAFRCCCSPASSDWVPGFYCRRTLQPFELV
jgi:ABC-type protease/lipase transport system fused ATPase/permease subunit